MATDVTATVRTVVAVVDQATGPLRNIQAQFKGFGAGLQGAAAKFKQLGDTTGISKLGSSLGGIAQKAGGVAKSIAGIGLSLAGVGGIAGGLGLRSVVGWMNDMVSAGGALHDTAPKLGVTVEQLQELQHWAQMGGVEAGTMQGAIGKLNKNLGDIATGKGKAAGETLAKLGIQAKGADGKMRSAADLMPAIADGLKKIENPAERAQIAVALFGRSGMEMLPALLEGGKAIADAAAEARKLGLITSEDAKRADEFGESQEKLGKAIQATQYAIGAKLLPVLQPVIEAMTRWVTTNREWMAGRIEAGITAVAEALRQVDWSAWGERLQFVLGLLVQFVNMLGGVQNALMLLAAVKFSGPLVSLGKTLMALWPVLVSIGSALVGIVGAPVLLGLAALAAAAALIYKNWDTIGPALARAWDAIKSGLSVIVAFVVAWGKKFLAAFEDVWDAVKQSVGGAFTALADAIGTELDKVRSVAATAWDAIKAVFTTGWGAIETVLAAFKGALDAIANVLGGLAGIAERALGGVAAALTKAKDAVSFWKTEAAPVVVPPGTGQAAGAAVGGLFGGKPGERGPGPWLPEIAAPGGAPSGTVDVVIENKNAPPGTRMTATSTGKGVRTQADVGYSMPQLQGAT